MDVQGGNVEIESQSGRNCVVSVHCVRDKEEVRVGHGGVGGVRVHGKRYRNQLNRRRPSTEAILKWKYHQVVPLARVL